MSNNPLQAVTQAVNSLVTALKLPDESAKANEILGEMSFPQFSRLLRIFMKGDHSITSIEIG